MSVEAGGELPETHLADFHNEEFCKKMCYRTLGNTQMKVSKLGLGCSAFGGVYGKIDENEVQTLIEDTLKKGVNYIDTAPWYGNAEEVLGRALKAKNIPRKSYYLATKVGRYSIGNEDIRKMFDFSADSVEMSVDNSLKLLGVDYIDLAQVHDIEFAPSLDIILRETLPTLQKLKDAGKIHFIGVTGLPLRVLKEVLEQSEVKIDTVLSYCHYSLNDTSLLDYLPFFQSKGLGIISASPNSMGLLSCDGPQEWHPADQIVKEKCKQARQYSAENNVDLAKLALDFSCSLDDIHTTLVSTSRLDYMKANIDVVLNGLDVKQRNVQNVVREKFFIPLNNRSWEENEVAEYRRKLALANSKLL